MVGALHHLVNGLLLVYALHFILGVLLDYTFYYLFKDYLLKALKLYMSTTWIMLAIFRGNSPASCLIPSDEAGNPVCISSCSRHFPLSWCTFQTIVWIATLLVSKRPCDLVNETDHKHETSWLSKHRLETQRDPCKLPSRDLVSWVNNSFFWKRKIAKNRLS